MNLLQIEQQKNHGTENLHFISQALDVDLDQALHDLKLLYEQTDQRIAARTEGLDFPCHAGCSSCCNAAVRFSFLEYVAVVEELRAQNLLDDFLLKALAIDPDDNNKADPILPEIDPAAQQACPVLGEDGLCRAYNARPLVCRLFGLSFNEQAGLYACQVVGEKFAGQELRLPRAQTILQQILKLPLSEKIDSFAVFARMLQDENER